MTARRAFLQWLGATPVATITPKLAMAAAVASPGAAVAARAADLGRGHVRLQDERLSLQFDERLRSRIVRLGGARPLALTGFDAGEQLIVAELKPKPAGGNAPELGAEAAGAPPALRTRSIDRFTLTGAVPASGATPSAPASA